MPDAGYSTLTELKKFVLPETIRSKDDWDTLLTNIGLGVAEQFDRHTGRRLRRAAGDTVEISAKHDHYILPRYPVESVSGVETLGGYGESWITESDAIEQLDEAAGILRFGARLGTERTRVRVTYTGGYWHDATGGDSLPAGATAIPADLSLAWQMQCAHVFEQRDKLGQNFTGADRGLGGALVGLIQIGLTDPVVDMLRPYKRMQLL